MIQYTCKQKCLQNAEVTKMKSFFQNEIDKICALIDDETIEYYEKLAGVESEVAIEYIDIDKIK